MLQFRVGVNPGYRANTGVAVQDLSLELRDSSGHVQQIRASAVPDAALVYPPGLPAGHFILNQIRFPLSSFTGIDLTHVTEVRVVFNRTDDGTIDMSDLAFTRGAGS